MRLPSASPSASSTPRTSSLTYSVSSDKISRESALEAVFEVISSKAAAEALFFSSLEPRVLDGYLTVLSPGIVQRLVALYEAEGKLRELESWLVRLEVHCLDFDQVRINVRVRNVQCELFTRLGSEKIMHLSESIRCHEAICGVCFTE